MLSNSYKHAVNVIRVMDYFRGLLSLHHGNLHQNLDTPTGVSHPRPSSTCGVTEEKKEIILLLEDEAD